MAKKQAIILGAGISGLSAGWKLAEAGYEVKIREMNDYIGGMSSTFQYKDYSLDYGPHKIFTVMNHIMDEINDLYAGEDLLQIKKKSHIRLRGSYLSYPVGMKDVFLSIGLKTGIACGFGYLGSILRNLVTRPDDRSYEDWVVNRFGRATYELVLGPYARKIWGNPTELSKDLAETRIAMPSLMEMIKQMIFGQKTDSPIINADLFFYPKQGFVDLSQKMSKKIQLHGGEICCRKKMTSVLFAGDRITEIVYADGSHDVLGPDDVLVSTVFLSDLVQAMGSDVPQQARQAADETHTRKLILLYVVLDQPRVTDDNWLFFPEGTYIFNRVFEQKGFNAAMIPSDKTVLCVEITCGEKDSLWHDDDNAIFNQARIGLEEAGLVPGAILEYFTKRVDNAYPIYDLTYQERLEQIMGFFDGIGNLFSIGRQGCYSYAGMADCLDMGIRTAGFIAAKSSREDWLEVRRQFYDYVVVD